MRRNVTGHFVPVAKVRVVTTQVMRKQRSDARDNRELILAAARAAFAAEGVDVPIRVIAQRAELGVATVYRHFPTKDALFTAAFAEAMTTCSTVVDEGLAAADPWAGFCLVIERIMESRATGVARAVAGRLAAHLTADRERTLRSLLQLLQRAKETGQLRADLVLDDIVLAIMANDGIRASSRASRVAASRRFAALMIQSFRADPVPTPLPPAVRLPVTAS
jgi:AcrR family transcriptional regulator